MTKESQHRFNKVQTCTILIQQVPNLAGRREREEEREGPTERGRWRRREEGGGRVRRGV